MSSPAECRSALAREFVRWRARLRAQARSHTFIVLGIFLASTAFAQDRFPGVGRAATPAEIRAWDIDVRGDFKGLPKGSGSVAKGQDVWEAKCASCHGVFGESNQVFPPIVGGTTARDMQVGRVASLTSGGESQRTTMMKLARLSTLWDYINRAMPWNNPRTLTVEEVYAVTGYILHLADMLPGDFVLADTNIREVQAKLPNRNGLTMNHGLWRLNGKPDVKSTACMSNCLGEGKGSAQVASSIPDHARDAHGNLALQQRTVGPVRGVVTLAKAAPASTGAAALAKAAEFADIRELANKGACLACHAARQKLVGPSFREIAARHQADAAGTASLTSKIKSGGSGSYGAIPMPPTTGLSDEEISRLASWILAGSPE